MNTLRVITGNQGKFNEIKNFLESYNFHIEQIDIDLEEIQELDPLKIIEHKAYQALQAGYRKFILEDTSLYINGLNRLPGTFIKWFLKELGPEGIYALASCMGDRSAVAETVIAYAADNHNVHVFRGETSGSIVPPRGTYGFGWSSIFQPNGSLKTYGEMLYEEKYPFNQRIKALEKFRVFLEEGALLSAL
jgi:inosine triphosphate pyrophosphatase